MFDVYAITRGVVMGSVNWWYCTYK